MIISGFDCPQVLMATNRIDILDAALLRPGRIDRKIEFPNPNEGSRFDILKIHSRKMNLMRGIDLKKIADKMPVSTHRILVIFYSSMTQCCVGFMIWCSISYGPMICCSMAGTSSSSAA